MGEKGCVCVRVCVRLHAPFAPSLPHLSCLLSMKVSHRMAFSG